VRRFVDEAKTTVELSHPNIVPVYELGVEQGIYYLAMELCDGVTLAELLCEAKKITPEEGAYVGIEICRALDYAHRKARIIHRDVTPRNVIIDEEGAVRLIDFGIAAPAYDGANEVFGSPGHMPPEQLRGEEVGPPADVFAVATLLYEAWSGRPPFRRGTPEQSQLALSEPLAALSTFDAALAPLDALMASALALDARERPQSAEDVSRRLRRFLAEWDLGDLSRKVGERVRHLRASSDADIGAETAESLAGATPVVNETRTFATRSPESAGSGALPAPSKPRHDALPDIPTRRMSDDAGSGPSAGGRTERRASVRPARARPYRGMVGMALGLIVVAAAAGAAWRYGEPRIAKPVEMAVAGANGARRPIAEEGATAGDARREATAGPRAEQAATQGGAPDTEHHGAANASAAGRATPGSGANAGALGHVRILANPMAHVEIDGKPRGVAPIADIALPAGTHFIRLDCSALGEAVAQNVVLAAGESVTISGDFTGAHGRILVRRYQPDPVKPRSSP
jgi:serine/threonine-protein kinase